MGKGIKPLFLTLTLLISHISYPISNIGLASESPLKVPWSAGEKLTYDIQWGFIKAGEASLEVSGIQEISVLNDPTIYKTYHLISTAHSTSLIDLFYKVRDRSDSWLDVSIWLSRRFEQHNREGSYVLDQIVDFDWKNKRFKYVDNVQGRPPKIEEGTLEIPAVDILSSLYLVRAKTFQIGDEIILDIHSGRNWPLVVKVLKRETVKVPAGKFDCFVVEPYLRERGLFVQKGKKLKVWLTADERKIPVMMKAEVLIGHVSAELKSLEGVVK